MQDKAREIVAKIDEITKNTAQLEDEVIRFQVNMARLRQNLWEVVKRDRNDDSRENSSNSNPKQ